MTTPLDAPGEPQDSLYVKTPVTPEEVFQAIGRLRKDARDEIDRLIRFLDETDNHMELEPDGDENEPGGDDELSLGSQDGLTNQAAAWKHPTDYHFGDCEVDDSDDEDGGDDEPSIGFDTEPAEQDTGNDEPSLGWTIDGCMTGGTGKGRHEVEVDLEIGDVARPPQNRTVVPANVAEETGYPNRRRRGFAVKRTDRPSNSRGLM